MLINIGVLERKTDLILWYLQLHLVYKNYCLLLFCPDVSFLKTDLILWYLQLHLVYTNYCLLLFCPDVSFLTQSIYKLLYNCLICLPSLHYALYSVVSYQHCEPLSFLCQHQCTSTSPLHLFQMNPRCKARYYIAWVSCQCYVSHVGFFCSFSFAHFLPKCFQYNFSFSLPFASN